MTPAEQKIWDKGYEAGMRAYHDYHMKESAKLISQMKNLWITQKTTRRGAIVVVCLHIRTR